jgi:aminopeptidase-like protein
MRSVWGQFAEYHTSADDLTFVAPEALEESLAVCDQVVDLLERNRTYRSTNPFCEPALGKRGLYRPTGGGGIGLENLARLWVLNLADGRHSLLDMAERSSLDFETLGAAADDLAANGLLETVEGAAASLE